MTLFHGVNAGISLRRLRNMRIFLWQYSNPGN